MLPPRFPALSALFVLLLAVGRCPAAALLGGSSPRPDARLDARSALEPLSRFPRSRTETAGATGHGVKPAERESRAPHGVEGLKDPRHKEKFIKHLTGPLHLNPKCRKHFSRLYNSTRECTIPAYYKRCARLLIRLANHPRCAER